MSTHYISFCGEVRKILIRIPSDLEPSKTSYFHHIIREKRIILIIKSPLKTDLCSKRAARTNIKV